MPITQIRDGQIRPVAQETVAAAEAKFVRFFVVIAVLFLIMIASMFVSKFNSFWAGNRIWSVGSFFVCVSVLQSRFFDIRKTAAPENQRITKDSRSPTTTFLEQVCAHIWLLGFVLIGVARWNPY